jgi:hypothetical protein
LGALATQPVARSWRTRQTKPGDSHDRRGQAQSTDRPDGVDLGGRRIIKKKNAIQYYHGDRSRGFTWPVNGDNTITAAFTFNNGSPDGLIATLSRPAGAGHIQTETADDFTLGAATSLTSATFTGLLPAGTPLTNISNVEIEF